ncbi:DUF4199 domain-containing protein [Bacteroidia bacterium]|nr:DUF4199 domain-containing protein [Bacteroidia bacterium]
MDAGIDAGISIVRQPISKYQNPYIQLVIYITYPLFVPMKNIILKYGLLSGAVISLVLVLGIVLMNKENPDLQMGQIIGYTGMAIAFLLFIPAIRKTNTIQPLSFGRAFLVGLQIMLVACAIYSLVWTFYIFLINPDGAKEMGEQYLKGLEAQGASSKDIATQKKFMDDVYENPLFCFLFTMIEPMIPGFIFSIIAAAVNQFKNNKKQV